jgi:large repetitive protein
MQRQSQKILVVVICIAVVAGVAVAFTFLGKELYHVFAGPAPEASANASSSGAKPHADGSRPKPERGNGRIFGTVSDAQGKALSGATVELIRREGGAEPLATAAADANGEFSFDKLAGMGYSVRARAAGFVPRTERAVKLDDAVQIRLSPGGVLLGRVLSADDGKGIAGASVTGMAPLGDSSRWEETIETGADGAYRFEAAPEQKIQLQVKASGYQTANVKDVEAPVGKETTKNIPLSTGLTVHGRVVDATSKAPIAGAKIRYGMGFIVDSSESESSANGEFTITGMPSGRQMLMAEAAGYTPARQEVTLSGDRKTEEVVLELTRGAVISGSVLGPDGSPVSGAKIFTEENAFILAKRSQSVATTDAQGKFSVTGIDGGKTLRIVAQSPNFPEVTSDEITTKAGEDVKDVTLRFEPGGEIAGTVHDPDGKPVAGATISVKETPTEVAPDTNPDPTANPNDTPVLANPRHAIPGRQLGTASTDSDGQYRITGLNSGMKVVEAKADGFLPGRHDGVRVDAGKKTENVDFTMDRGKTIAGRVLDSAGSPVQGVRVSGSSPGAASGMASYGTTTSDAEGKYKIEKLQPGKFMLTAAKQGYTADRKRDVESGAENVDFTLKKNGSISGMVVFPSASGPRNFTITARSAADPSNPDDPPRAKSRSYTAEDGKFKLDDVPGGVYSVQVVSKNFAPASVDNVVVNEGQETSGITITVREGGTIDGFVQDRSGTGIARASVSAQPTFEVDPTSPLGQSGPSVVTDKTGYYKLSGLTEGQYEIFATASKYTTAPSQQAIAAEGKTARANFTLAPGASLTVIVQDASGSPIGGAKVDLVDEKGKATYPPRIEFAIRRYQKNPKVLQSFMEKFNLTDPNGRVPFENIPEGTYKIAVSKDGSTASGTVKLGDDEAKEERIVLK